MPNFPQHQYGFDPTYGYTLDTLLAVQPPEDEPRGFEAFWQQTYADTLAVPLNIEQTMVPTRNDAYTARLVHFDGWGGVRLGGWLIEPLDRQIDRYVVTGHGYYNRPFEDLTYVPRVANFYFGCRGLGVSRVPGVSDQTMFHVLHGIEAKETYIHRGCVADTWSAASVMLHLFKEAAGRLEYSGGSFGGGMGAMALAWDDRFVFGKLSIPSFGHHPLRLAVRCTGAGDAVRRKYERSPEIYENTLRYFDATVHAKRIKMPTSFSCALFDPAVPPQGQFAIHNAAVCPKNLTVLHTGHHNWSGTEDDWERAEADAAALRRAAGLGVV